MDFEQFISDIKTNRWIVYGVEIYEHGKKIHSFGDTCQGRYDIYSATKTILSIAAGIAYDRGLIDLDASVLGYLPKEKVNAMSDQKRKQFQNITIKRLLTMSVDGFPFRPSGDDYLDFCLSCDIKNPDEKVFHYSNISAHLVGSALNFVLQEDLGEFIVHNILEPLQITDFEYGRSPEGCFYGASMMKMTVNELSRIGQLLCSKGKYHGKQIVSEEYIQMATSVQQMNREGGYGFYIWKYRDGFSINGKWGQKCYCLPERGLMVTYLAHMEDNSHELKESMEKYIL